MTRTRDEAARLLDEAKRYLVLSSINGGTAVIPIFSRRVDEAWHQFALFTFLYFAEPPYTNERFRLWAPLLDDTRRATGQERRHLSFLYFAEPT